LFELLFSFALFVLYDFRALGKLDEPFILEDPTIGVDA
jgi:hypothetical protein